jgi:putative SOS response-associated peptidase YedK
MCGFIYNVTDFPLLLPLFEIAGYNPAEISDIIQKPFLRPTDTVLTLSPSRSGPKFMGSTWWLATNPNGSVNTSITSFNSKSSKVGKSPLHLQKPRSIRSIVVGSGFCEWQPIYKGEMKFSECIRKGLDPSKLPISRKVQHLIEPTESPLMLFGAVSKLRINLQGLPQVNTSIITLPPHDGFMDIHSKSFPLILRDSELLDWLNPLKPYSDFDNLLSMASFRDSFSVSQVSSDFSVKKIVLNIPPDND